MFCFGNFAIGEGVTECFPHPPPATDEDFLAAAIDVGVAPTSKAHDNLYKYLFPKSYKNHDHNVKTKRLRGCRVFFFVWAYCVSVVK